MEGTFSMNGLIRRAVVAAISVVAVTGAIAAPASAGILTAPAKDCGDESLSQPFAQFGDKSQYKLVQGGSFESSLADYTLMGGAKVVSGNEPWKVGGPRAPGGQQCDHPAGAVGLAEPTLRFFAKKNRRSRCRCTLRTSLGLVVPWVPGPSVLCSATVSQGITKEADRRHRGAAASG